MNALKEAPINLDFCSAKGSNCSANLDKNVLQNANCSANFNENGQILREYVSK